MITILIYSLFYLTLFSFSDFIFYKFSLPADTTRKIVHVVSGIIALSFPLYFESIWQVAVITSGFILLLSISEKKGWFKSITAVNRRSWGSWLYPLAILICFITMKLQHSTVFYYVPILTLAFSDTLASVVGRRFPNNSFSIYGNTKTWMGSGVFFISTFLISIFIMGNDVSIFQKMIFALSITVVEAISYKGVDNLTIPLACIIFLFFLI